MQNLSLQIPASLVTTFMVGVAMDQIPPSYTLMEFLFSPEIVHANKLFGVPRAKYGDSYNED